MYRVNPNYSAINDEPKVIKESHFYVSDDKKHDIFLFNIACYIGARLLIMA
jgi:hypothetical protein